MKEREIVEKEGESLGDVVEDEMASTSVVRNTHSLWYLSLIASCDWLVRSKVNYNSDSQIGCTTILYIINYVFLCSQIVDEAAKKIAELLKRSHEQHTGINLEVNSRILDSCTDLMQSIQMLMQRSIDLQREIVTQVWYSWLLQVSHNNLPTRVVVYMLHKWKLHYALMY